MTDTTDEIKDVAKLLGKRGENSTMKKYGTTHFSTAGKLGNEKRWAEHRKKKAQELENKTSEENTPEK